MTFHLSYKIGPNCFSHFFFHSAKVRPKLKSRHRERVKVAFDHARTINDFDDLINPRTLYHHFLGPEPSPFVLRAIEKEEKSKLHQKKNMFVHSFIHAFCANSSPYCCFRDDDQV